MPTKLRWLLLDANIIIEAFRQGIWEQLVRQCEIHLPRTVVEEAQFYEDEKGVRHEIDLSPWESSSGMTVFDTPVSRILEFRDQFSPLYLEKLDPGEVEALTFLFSKTEKWKVCSADAIVYRVLGAHQRSYQGVSFEEVLAEVGLARSLDTHFSKAFREKWTQKGFEEGLGGLSKKRK